MIRNGLFYYKNIIIVIKVNEIKTSVCVNTQWVCNKNGIKIQSVQSSWIVSVKEECGKRIPKVSFSSSSSRKVKTQDTYMHSNASQNG